MSFADINGTKIYYEDVGAGEPIIFSHGLLWDTSMYHEQVAQLSRNFRCISYDHRGQGKSADDHECNEISVERLCADVVALIDLLQLGPIHFVGHSLGGFVGIMLASRFPERVRSLILCNTSADEEPRRNLFKYRLLNACSRILGPGALADPIMPLVFSADALSDTTRRQKFRTTIIQNRRTIWRAANGVINRPSQKESLKDIKAPTLIITAPGDTARTRDESDRLASGIPNAKLVCLDKGAHMLPLEQPEQLTRLIAEFLG